MAGFFNRISNIYNFKPETSIPDLIGKVIIVTGGNTGLGYQTVLQLAPHNPHTIILTARTQAKFDSAISNLRTALSDKKVIDLDKMIRFIQMDLASLASVKAAADTILKTTDRIDILVNNAGIMGTAAGLTTDGYEVHFGTNHMGHALFTQLLTPLLLRTAETNKGSEVRIINVSSGAYYLSHAKGWDAELVKTDMASFGGKNGNLMSRYGQSKLANVLHAKGLAKHYPSLTAVAIAPGRVKTELLGEMMNSGRDRFYSWFQCAYDAVIGAHPVDVGAWTQVWAATESEKSRVKSGGIYFPIGVKDKESDFARDDKMVDAFWEWTEKELREEGY